MKIVIDIPEETYYAILANKGEQISNLERIILDGKPLPAKYGDLIDRDEVLDNIVKQNPAWVSETDKHKRYARLVYYWAVKNAPTILETSGGDSE